MLFFYADVTKFSVVLSHVLIKDVLFKDCCVKSMMASSTVCNMMSMPSNLSEGNPRTYVRSSIKIFSWVVKAKRLMSILMEKFLNSFYPLTNVPLIQPWRHVVPKSPPTLCWRPWSTRPNHWENSTTFWKRKTFVVDTTIVDDHTRTIYPIIAMISHPHNFCKRRWKTWLQ